MAESDVTSAQRQVEVFADPAALHAAAGELFVDSACRAVQANGRFSVALAGGATPNGLYTLLATKPFRSRVPWAQVHVFWGDERCVPPDDPRSNYRAGYELLLSKVPVPPAQIHRIPGEIDAGEAARGYEQQLRAHFDTPSGAPRFAPRARFDLVLLGLGVDGHTASLFPGGNAVGEQQRWAVAEYAKSAAMWRVTLTPPLINAAAQVLFLVSGSEKRDIVRALLDDASEASAGRVRYPAETIAPLEGALRWFVDAATVASAPE